MSATTIAEVPTTAVTRISTTPTMPAGETAVIWVELLTVKLDALTDPNITADTSTKFVPVMTTPVPPLVEPVDGPISTTVTALVYVNRSDATTAEVPPEAVTRISTTPAIPAGDVAMMLLALLTVKLAALTDPNITADTSTKFVPVMTTPVPPLVEPVDGPISTTVTALVYVN